jgi:uncharacterized protein YjgD (DUF1641 family)
MSVAEPDRDVPPGATNRESGRDGDGETALRAAIAAYGDEYAAAMDHTDELVEVVETAILVVAGADDEDVEHVTDSMVSLTNAADALTTEQAVMLADAIGDNGDALASMTERMVDVERSGDLEELLEMAKLAADLDLDQDTVEGMNRLFTAVGDVERGPETDRNSVGVLGLVRSVWDADVRAGLGYIVAVLRALGRRRRAD